MMSPEAFSLGPLVVRWYSLAYVAGITLGWAIMRRTGRRFLAAAQIDDLVFACTLGVILGGRLGYVLFYNLMFYLDNPLEIVKVWNGGMSFHGGFAGVCLAIVWFARTRKTSVLRLGDLVCSILPIGLFFGRLANYVNGELGGRALASPVKTGSYTWFAHPTQLYEAALEGLLLLVVVGLCYHRYGRTRAGTTAGAFCVGYALCRFAVEFWRLPDAQIGYLAWGWLTMGQVLTVPVFALGLALIAWPRKEPQSR
ncbi:prolipoprotein diacylglyceryl transferase [Alphaproteobacteria bacterium]|nr:prolipoprotein diacylglyceryl transferase [Alphaproteobacteria bacterium]